MGFIGKLKLRWKLKTTWMVWLILLVFCLTGSTVMYLKRFVQPYMGDHWWVDVVYYILVLPFYNILLLMYGFIFGQFKYFWAFEKRFFQRIVELFR
ncbi:MAG: prolipoprotein diacylglyceryl transferase [Flavobacteriales bacterium]|nr:MAG: prolipoprotein diacylglyceryl transferase [Flavobacteriales bacterium]